MQDVSAPPPHVPELDTLSPLSIAEQKSVWKRLKTFHTDNNNVVQLTSNNNKPISLLHIPNARVGSNDASRRTLHNRVRALQQINTISSTPSPCPSPSIHVNAQIHALNKRLNINISHTLSHDDMLNFDKLTYLPYNTIRTIRSFLSQHNIHILPSEPSMRQHAKQYQYEYDIGNITIDNTNISFCRIHDISTLLNTQISYLYNNQQLIHYPNMPNNQIQIQTQTDKGADSTKLSIQIINQHDINSVKHVLPVACYEGTCIYI
jgi:hypothetical protein